MLHITHTEKEKAKQVEQSKYSDHYGIQRQFYTSIV
jgi:hypothetical protein